RILQHIQSTKPEFKAITAPSSPDQPSQAAALLASRALRPSLSRCAVIRYLHESIHLGHSRDSSNLRRLAGSCVSSCRAPRRPIGRCGLRPPAPPDAAIFAPPAHLARSGAGWLQQCGNPRGSPAGGLSRSERERLGCPIESRTIWDQWE